MLEKAGFLNLNAPNAAEQQKNNKDINQVASEFESLFIYYMLKTMRESVMKGGLFDDKSREIYASMLDQELSVAAAKAGGIGLKEVILRDLNRIKQEDERMRNYEIERKNLTSQPQNISTSALFQSATSGENGFSEDFGMPVRGGISSGYGIRKDPIDGDHRFHHGIDIPASEGTPIYPSREGIVTFSGSKDGYGNMVEIRHENGYVTVYAHNQKNIVKEGDRVVPTDIIAFVGRTGRVTGSHLHFEVKIEGFSVNPLDIVRFS